jgi:hypothetical protein
VQVPCNLREALGYTILSNEPPQLMLHEPDKRLIFLPYSKLAARPAASLRGCKSNMYRDISEAPYALCSASAVDQEDGDLSSQISVHQIDSCPPTDMSASLCALCSTRMMDLRGCPRGFEFRYQYTVMDSQSNVQKKNKTVVTEALVATVECNAIFSIPRITTASALRSEAELWAPARTSEAGAREAAVYHTFAHVLGPSYAAEDVEITDVQPLEMGGTWLLNVTVAISVTDRHARPWYEMPSYMEDLRLSVHGTQGSTSARSLRASKSSSTTTHSLGWSTLHDQQTHSPHLLRRHLLLTGVASQTIRSAISAAQADLLSLLFTNEVTAAAVEAAAYFRDVYKELEGDVLYPPVLLGVAEPATVVTVPKETNLIGPDIVLPYMDEVLRAVASQLPALSDSIWCMQAMQ